MKKNRIDQNIVGVLVFTLLTVVTWIGFELFRTLTRVDVDPKIQTIITELDPRLDQEVLDILLQKHP